MTPQQVMDKTGIGPDKFQKMRLGRYDQIPQNVLIEILTDLSVPKKRWTKEKADRAAALLLEVSAVQIPPNESPPLIQSFEQEPERVKISAPIKWAMAVCIIIVLGHAALIWADCSKIWGFVGMFAGGIVFAIQVAAILITTDTEQNAASEWALLFVCGVDIAAFFLHYPAFLASAQVEIGRVETGFLCAFLCATSFISLFLYMLMRKNY